MKIKTFNKFGIFSFICCFFLSAQAQTKTAAKTSYLIVPGKSVGAITADSSEAQLKKIYGAANVQTGEVSLGEGEFETGTILFPKDPLKRVDITWWDKEAKRFPQSVSIFGEKTVWKTRQGVSLGTSLKELEQINGRAFHLYGFGWDYAGTITSWKRGKLAREFDVDTNALTVRLSERGDLRLSEKEYRSVLGDGQFSSSNRVMRKINPWIYHIEVNFPQREPAEQN